MILSLVSWYIIDYPCQCINIMADDVAMAMSGFKLVTVLGLTVLVNQFWINNSELQIFLISV